MLILIWIWIFASAGGFCVVRWLGYLGIIMDNMASVLGGYLGNPPHYSHILGGRTYNIGTSCLVYLYLWNRFSCAFFLCH